MIKLEKNNKILFQGDSITDAGRDRDNLYSLGNGYVAWVGAYLQASFPELNLTVMNKGVSCECTVDMVKRWKNDTIDLNPDILVFMGGINDTWRRYDGADTVTSPEEYENNLRIMLEESKKASIDKIVLMEPYLTMNSEIMEKMLKEDLCYKQEAVVKLAKEFNCEFVPLQSVFDNAVKQSKPEIWTVEGVHPLWPGCGLIGKSLLKVFGINI